MIDLDEHGPYIRGTRLEWDFTASVAGEVQSVAPGWQAWLAIAAEHDSVSALVSGSYPDGDHLSAVNGKIRVSLPAEVTRELPAGCPLFLFLKIQAPGHPAPLDQPANAAIFTLTPGGPLEPLPTT